MNDRCHRSASASLPAFLVTLFACAGEAAARGPFAAGAMASGYTVPLGSLEPLLAFLAVGLWAARWGGAALWQIPIAAVAGAACGGLLASSGLHVPYAEQAPALSLIVLGGVVLIPVRVPYPLAITAILGALNGLVAGGDRGDPLGFWAGYGIGVLIAAAAGIGATGIVSQILGSFAVRLAGAAVAAVGVLVLLGHL